MQYQEIECYQDYVEYLQAKSVSEFLGEQEWEGTEEQLEVFERFKNQVVKYEFETELCSFE